MDDNSHQIKQIFDANTSDIVYCIDIHPKHDWIVCGLQDGYTNIWDYNTKKMINKTNVSGKNNQYNNKTGGIYSVKFIEREKWVATGDQHGIISIFDYQTNNLVKSFKAHSNAVTSISIHTILPYMLTSSFTDADNIKLWNWNKNWKNIKQYRGHNRTVNSVAFNPNSNYSNTFASVSYDNTIKFWNIENETFEFELTGHSGWVRCLSFYVNNNNNDYKPWLVSGSDDKTVKIWNYETKKCIKTLYGHSDPVTSVLCYPHMPYIFSGSDDKTIRIWDCSNNEFECIKTLNYAKGLVFAIGFNQESNKIGFGFRGGISVIECGNMNILSYDNNSKSNNLVRYCALSNEMRNMLSQCLMNNEYNYRNDLSMLMATNNNINNKSNDSRIESSIENEMKNRFQKGKKIVLRLYEVFKRVMSLFTEAQVEIFWN